MEIKWGKLSLESRKLTKQENGVTLTLDIAVNDVCSSCYKPKTSSYCCGYNSKKVLDINARVHHNYDLKSDLEKALFNENLSDFSFIVNDEKVPVNKFILSARSPVFERMFNSDFKETNEDQQILGINMSTEAFKELIRYIYINEVCDLDKHVFELLHAADFYQIESLKRTCEKEMLKILNITNANDIFQAAHLYRCSEELKKASFAVIVTIFNMKHYNIPQEFVHNASKVEKLINIKGLLEEELRSDVVN